MKVRSVLLLRVSSEVDKEVDHPQFFDPPYPLKYLQAGLARYRDLSVRMLDCWIRPMDVPQIVRYTAKVQPDLVVISASSFDIQVANDVVGSLKKQNASPLVIGVGQGHYVNRDCRNDYQAAYDAILLGEPEQEFFRLFAWIEDGGHAGTDWKDYYRQCYVEGKRFLVEDPDALPFPSYTAEEMRAYRSIFPVKLPKRVVWGYLIATRGCPHGCMFCSEVMRVSIGKKLRSRSAPNIADEMEHLGRQGVNICSFQDDSFSANRRLVRSLCEELITRNSKMPWMARVRVDEVTYDLLALMKKAGCIMLGLGVESGNQRIIDGMNKQKTRKSWLDLCRQAFHWTRKLGIGTNAYYVIGNPTETREEIEQTMEFALELDSDSIQVHFYTPYPGSAAWEKYQDQIAEHDPARMFHYATPLFSLAKVSSEELVELRSKFYRRYIFRPGFAIKHMRRHLAFYWHNPDIFLSLLGIRKIF
ncbi:MAG: radical SAM protein [Deltaproteobacteria bacterium]|nr:MAG: radical SAM protein [Deltaproteobacteria bacterium]